MVYYQPKLLERRFQNLWKNVSKIFGKIFPKVLEYILTVDHIPTKINNQVITGLLCLSHCIPKMIYDQQTTVEERQLLQKIG